MNKSKIIFIPILIGVIFFFYSWYVSYPISIESPYDFDYDYIFYLYWLSIPILFASSFYIIIKTNNDNYKLLMTIITILIMYSKQYFYYMGFGSDVNQFIGLTEYFISSGDLDFTRGYHSYYQWPNFFILNKIATSIIGIDLRIFQFILYFIITVVITIFLYLYALKNGVNGYFYVITFFIMLFYFFNFQTAPYTLSMVLLLMLLYLVDISDKQEVVISIFIIFISMTYMHILVPIFFILYSLLMYIIIRRENTHQSNKYKSLFIITFIIYTIIQMYNLFPSYIENITELSFLEFLRARAKVTLASSVSEQPLIDIVAQFFSRIVVATTTIITGVGFLILLLIRKLKKTNYAVLITGLIFTPTLIVSSKSYSNIFFRALPLICIPLCLGTTFLYESKFKKYIKSIYLILIILFTFVMIHNSFYDRQIFTLSINEYHNANYLLDNINFNTKNRMLSHIRYYQYFVRARLVKNINSEHDFSTNFPHNINKYNYIAYTVGLGKSYLRSGYSVDDSFMEFEMYHFNLIYNAGNFSYIFNKD